MIAPDRPDFIRIYVSAKVDHLAPATDRLNPQPLCGQKSLQSWTEYHPAPTDGVHVYYRCAALAEASVR